MTWVWIAVSVVVTVLCAVGLANSGDSDLTVPAPEPTDRSATVADLDRAYQAQGICYGWRLTDRFRERSVGSNLGDGVPVNSDLVQCARWMQVNIAVYYTSESSESEDSAYLTVSSSDDLRGAASAAALDRLGISEKAAIDEPGDAACRAALALPLLVAQADLAPPVPAPSDSAPVTATDPAVRDLAGQGSDYWRERLTMVLLAVGFILSAVGAVFLGRRKRRQARSGRSARTGQRRTTAGAKAAGAKAAGAGSAGAGTAVGKATVKGTTRVEGPGGNGPTEPPGGADPVDRKPW